MPEFVIELVCESDPAHTSYITLEGCTREYADRLAGIMDGTSDFYLYPPRDSPTPGSMLARCQRCQGWLLATVKEG